MTKINYQSLCQTIDNIIFRDKFEGNGEFESLCVKL